MKLQLIVKACAPIALSASRANAQFAQGLDYIPGSTLRGALAAMYLGKNPGQPHDETFRTLFLSHQVSYPDLLPTVNQTMSAIFPATAQACKRYKLKHPESLEDGLAGLAVQASRLQGWEQELGPVPEILTAGHYCSTCQSQSPLHQLTGYYTMTAGTGYTIQQVKIHQRLIAGTSINRATGTAQQGMLFSRDVLEEGQYFSGQIRLAETWPPQLKQLIQPGLILRVGYGRSRGLGKLEVISAEDSLDTGSELTERWQKFNEKVLKMGLPAERAYFSLTLQSDWIRVDRNFYLPLDLPDQAELNIVGLQRHRCVSRPTTVMGWNAAMNLPKESQPALKRGSVLLFSVPAQPEMITAAQTRLRLIEAEGVGERRNEGFGRVSVCDPFHYETITVEDNQ
jgi:CRISPR-associated protein Csx10